MARPVLDLPTDRPRPARRSFASAREDRVLDADAGRGRSAASGARRARACSRPCWPASPARCSRLTGQADLVVGIPAAGQSAGGHEAVVGHCVNLLPLRLRVDAAQPFARPA